MKPARVSSIRKSYKTYLEKHDKKSPNYLTYKQYINILETLMEEIVYHLITTGEKIVFPKYMGAMQIIRYKRPPGRKAKNYGSLKEFYRRRPGADEYKARLNVTIYTKHNNLTTDGYWPRIHWFKQRVDGEGLGTRFRNARSIAFKLSRPNLRPNSYNKNNPRVSLYPYFRDVMWNKYREL